MSRANETSRERLIVATIREIETHGIADFSIRRVAAACSVSCAAPYKHFKNRNELIAEALRYINRRWRQHLEEIVLLHPHDDRAMLTDICLSYIRFLSENPGIQSIVMLNDNSVDAELIREKGEISAMTSDIVHRYCTSVNMSETDALRKTYIVRSLIFGAVMLLKNGSLKNSAETYEMIRATIDREFDLP